MRLKSDYVILDHGGIIAKLLQYLEQNILRKTMVMLPSITKILDDIGIKGPGREDTERCLNNIKAALALVVRATQPDSHSEAKTVVLQVVQGEKLWQNRILARRLSRKRLKVRF